VREPERSQSRSLCATFLSAFQPRNRIADGDAKSRLILIACATGIQASFMRPLRASMPLDSTPQAIRKLTAAYNQQFLSQPISASESRISPCAGRVANPPL